MKAVYPAWADHELAFIKEKWLIGWTDAEIATELKPRTVKAVQGKRLELRLLAKLHPDRPNPRARYVATNYSRDDETDILRRFNAQEPVASIALSYHVTTRAMNNKVDRLLERSVTGMPQKTERGCLGCGNKFVSILPKSVHRRCDNCHATLIAGGASFLTAY